MWIDGHLTAKALSALSIEVGKFIQSDNYSPGSSGWHIAGDGTLEANSGIFRGTVSAEAVIATGTFLTELANFQSVLCEFGLTVDGTIFLDNPPGATPPAIGFFDVGSPGVTKRTVTGSTADQKVDSLISALAQYGLVTDSTT